MRNVLACDRDLPDENASQYQNWDAMTDRTRIWLAATTALLAAGPAEAQSPGPAIPAGGTSAQEAAPGEPGFGTGLFSASRNTLLGDAWGLRSFAGRYGVSLGLQEQSEDLGNVSGGIHRGFDYDGLTLMSLEVDTGRAFGWPGGTFHVSAEQIHGRSVSTDNLDDLQTASGIEAERSTRLWELWFAQTLADGRVGVKIGQQSIDQEFIVSTSSGLYLNTMMGWPLVPSYDLYAGGPAYPLSSLGVRVEGQVTPSVMLIGGVFDDNPPGGPFDDDDQLRGAEQSGTEFDLGTGALWIGEVQYNINQPATGQMVGPGDSSGLPGTYKLGAWYDSGAFPDQRFGADRLSLADPASGGAPLNRRGNWSIYAVADQMVWRPDPQGPQSINLFLRVMGAPPDRNLVSFSANGGVNLKAPFKSRSNDTFGVGFGVGQVSRQAAGLDADTAAFDGAGNPIRTVETFLEVTYQVQVAPWWNVQPDLQYVFHPGGGIADPSEPDHEVGDELVVGARTAITF